MLYKIADVIFDIKPYFDYSYRYMEDYVYSGSERAELEIKFDKTEIDEQSKKEEGPLELVESLMIFRKICEYIFEYKNGFIFHSSVIKVGDSAILFSAPSGTGKSTHARMWRETFDDVTMLNDDKPIIRLIDGDFIVYGTPWRGKHRLGENTSAKVKAICFVERSTKNSAVAMSSIKALPLLLNQTLRFQSEESFDKLFGLMETLIRSVSVYKINVDISHDAAKVVRSAVLEDI